MLKHVSRPDRHAVMLSTLAIAVVALVSACGGSGADRDGPFVYGSNEYTQARIAMYEDAGLVEKGTLVKEHLPWDPNGPTVKMSDLQQQLIEATNFKGQYSEAGADLGGLIQNIQGICDGTEFTPGLVPGTVEYDKTTYVDEAIGTLRLGSGVGDGGIDASGGIDCENGKIATGTGEPIFSDYGPHDENDEVHKIPFDLGSPSWTIVKPLTPPVSE